MAAKSKKIGAIARKMPTVSIRKGDTKGMATHNSMRGRGVNDDRPMYRTNPTK